MSFANTALYSVPTPQPMAANEPSPVVDDAHALRGEITLSLNLRHAGTRQVKLRYELLGAAGLPVVLVAGGISAHRHVVASKTFPENGWANALAQAGRALDPAHRRLLAIDYLGADGKLDVPLETADQADAIVHLLDALQIQQLHLRRGALGSHMRQFMQRYDLIATPAIAVPAFAARPAGQAPMTPASMLGWTPFSYPFNLTQQPACTVPCGFTAGGLPIGLQLVGPMFGDAQVLRAARAYEASRNIPTVAPTTVPA